MSQLRVNLAHMRSYTGSIITRSGSKSYYSKFARFVPRSSARFMSSQPILRPNLADTEFKGSNIAVPGVMRDLLSHPTLVIERQIEYMNLFAGFEQVNRYQIYSEEGDTIGYMEEVDRTLTRAIMRQVYRLHRPFTVNVYNAAGEHALTIHRSFSLINSHIKASLPGRDYNDPKAIIGESSQEWHPWRRRYNLYMNNVETNDMDQFGRVDAQFLSYTFRVHDEENELIGSVDRNWVGIAREMFTDTGVYVLRWDHTSLQKLEPNVAYMDLSLEQRAVMLSMAVSVDYDYFSRHSNRPGGGMFGPAHYE